MPYIICNGWFPAYLIPRVIRKFFETEKKLPLPSFVKEVIPLASKSIETGFYGMSVYEVKREDLGDAYDYHVKKMAEFNDLEGFRHEINVYNTLNESLQKIGMVDHSKITA